MYSSMINLLVLAAGVAAAPATSTCNADNCLRAVRASAFPTNVGTRDCSSYFLTTVTPATSTSTVTVTISPTSTFSPTVTNTHTLIDSETNTSTSTIVDTITSTYDVDITSTVTIVPTNLPKKRAIHEDLRAPPSVTLAPRQVTVQPSSIPTYASACSGSVRYSSACSCIGVTKSTTTAPTPVTVVTVTATAVQDLTLTQTSSALVTSYVTETAFATTTQDISTTVTDTVVAATTTVSPLCPPQPTSLILQAVGGPYNSQYAQLINANDGLDDYVLVFSPNEADATSFNIDSSGHLNAFGYYANIEAGVQHFLFYFNTPSDISAYGYVYATCSVAPTGALSCVDQTSTMFQISPSVESSGGGGDGVVIGAYIEDGNTEFSFQALCT